MVNLKVCDVRGIRMQEQTDSLTQEEYEDQSLELFKFLYQHIPSGTFDRVVEILTTKDSDELDQFYLKLIYK